MLIIDEDGKYAYVPNTRKLQTSDHPVYRARIEVALGQGEWIGAPHAGHHLARFKRSPESVHQIEEFQKELAYYLDRYAPDVLDALVVQGGVTFDLQIKAGALNGVV